METTKASDFKNRCLAVLDRFSATGKSAVMLKHGRSAAEPLPVRSVDVGRPQSGLVGTVTVVRDIVGPVVAEGE